MFVTYAETDTDRKKIYQFWLRINFEMMDCKRLKLWESSMLNPTSCMELFSVQSKQAPSKTWFLFLIQALSSTFQTRGNPVMCLTSAAVIRIMNNLLYL